MPGNNLDIEEAIIAALRRIVRAIDLQSRQLAARCGVTGPQLVTLRAMERLGNPSLSQLSKEVSIGQATITGILDRLERQLLAARCRDAKDRRRITVSLTEKGRELLRKAPPLLQEKFRTELAKLADWEQAATLSTLQRVASMMDAEHIDVTPILDTVVSVEADESSEKRNGGDSGTIPAGSPVTLPKG